MNELSCEIAQRSITFLHKLALNDSLKVPALLTNYSTKCTLLEFNKQLHLPTRLKKNLVKCSKCLIYFKNGQSVYKIKKNERSKFANRVLKKNNDVSKKLTSFQRNYLKHIGNKLDNTLNITCQFCNKETNIHLTKPAKLKDVGPVNQKSKRKKKKKDQFAGLNKNVVLQINKNNAKHQVTPSSTKSNQKTNDSIVIITDTPEKPDKSDKTETPIRFKNLKFKPKPEVKEKPKLQTIDPNSKSAKKKKNSLNKLKNQLSSTPENSPVSKLQLFLNSLT
ncbi:uncharacterized protein LOC109602098 [Aethina tumida]|uniref:uncharacterized protein LOC109602098 n=1 Tax=Aethina tumida TaxID=116153 RepID=UPI0021473855|nr:uncharacterized protein LOC109602098 [Aethina tumida]